MIYLISIIFNIIIVCGISRADTDCVMLICNIVC